MKLDVLGTVLCEQCPAACCRYVALPLDKPRTLRDYDDIRWYLMHEGFSVFVEEGDWYVQVQAKCRNLGEDNLCGVYPTRPEICREYEPGECDYPSGGYGYDHLFTHPSQIETYVENKLGKRLGVNVKPPATNGRDRNKERANGRTTRSGGNGRAPAETRRAPRMGRATKRAVRGV